LDTSNILSWSIYS